MKHKIEKGDVNLLTTLHNNPKNPRTITPQALDQLSKALVEFGDLGGIVFNRRTNHLVGGHQRIAAFRSAEVKAVVETVLPKPDKVGTVAHGFIDLHGTRFNYREVDWDETRELAANIAANNNGGEFDEQKLRNVLQSLNAAETPLYTTGFSEEELKRLLTPPDEPAATVPSRRQSDDEYALFELVMRIENKNRLVIVLDRIRKAENLTSLEDALMQLIREYEGHDGGDGASETSSGANGGNGTEEAVSGP